MDPQQSKIAETFDQYKDTYSKSVDDAVAFTGLKTDFFTRVKADYILDLTANLPEGRSSLNVIDIGCGVGNYHPLLASHFGTMTGVDISKSCIETARNRNPSVRYEVYDGRRLPFDDASFDVAYTICVMHHVVPADWPAFMREMHRVLKPGGLALVFEHNPRNPLTMRAVNNCPFDADAVLMRSDLTRGLAKEAGFRDIGVQYILSVPPFNGFLRRLDGLLSGFRLGAQYYMKSHK